MWLDNLDFVLEVNWAVAIYLELLGVGLADLSIAAHIDELGEQVVLSRVYHREGVDGDHDLVPLTVNSHRVIVVLIFVHCRRELNIDILSYTRWNHTFLLVSNLEVGGLGWEDVQALRS